MKHALVLSASVAVVLSSLSGMSYAHENGPFTITDNFQATNASCSRIRGLAKRDLRKRVRAHCQSTHDSGPNALRNTSFRKGTCEKTKNQPAVNGVAVLNTTRLIDASFTGQCR